MSDEKKDDRPGLSLGEDLPSFILPMLEASRQLIEKEHRLFSRLNLRATRIARGEAAFTLSVPGQFSEGAAIHGGVFTILLDTILAYTVWTRMEKFEPIATINLKTDYLGHALPDEKIVCTAWCEGITDDVAFCTGKAAHAGTGETIAMAEGTFMVGTKGRSTASRL